MKKYSLTAHALHSRLQLVHNKLDAEPKMDPSQVVIRNLKIFEKAGQSVAMHHNQLATRTEYLEAAELFLMTVEGYDAKQPTKKEELYVVLVRLIGHEWYPMTEEMISGGKSSEVRTMTQEEAKKLYLKLCSRGKPSDYRVSIYTPDNVR
ncbi:MAG: hypothetical protein BGO21_29870 [Dyadobacter sp. 50-39]|uniref:hypothetical protein n=1 Tax=Dyadobacter sp. 50-39 TaxID=1895756 RepID=UPI000965D23F|nr:hypothetical protein [Dyadobacter sp. 50-39]OJV15215.1 MAG: hypothetical protein BGO21_29870 [Dyadobacter sp. 50-39]